MGVGRLAQLFLRALAQGHDEPVVWAQLTRMDRQVTNAHSLSNQGTLQSKVMGPMRAFHGLVPLCISRMLCWLRTIGA